MLLSRYNVYHVHHFSVLLRYHVNNNNANMLMFGNYNVYNVHCLRLVC